MLSRLRRDRVFRGWAIAWLGGSLLGVANGVLRELAYKNHVGERNANRISAVTLMALLACYFNALERHWPIPTNRQAGEIGGLWVALTVIFEFSFGHYVDRKSWSNLVDNYDVTEGHLWPLVLLWIGVGPAATRRYLNNSPD
jgi:predicted outer membrane lipoprotein